MSKVPEFLPLGSAVTVEDDDGTFIIVARGFQKAPEGFVAGYKAVLHPVGSGAGAKEVVLRQKQITKVVHRGFESPEDAVFAKKQLEVAKAPPVEQPPVPEPDLTIDLSRPTAAPAVSAASAAPSTVAVSDPKDPFSELRSKGKKK